MIFSNHHIVDFQEYKRRVREAYKKRDKSGDDELLQAFGKEIQQAIAEREDKGKHSITVKAMRKEVEKLVCLFDVIHDYLSYVI
ncbi:MAG: hypothetical protein ACREHG_02765 [Candidatus Saccharimonadales bacterium]